MKRTISASIIALLAFGLLSPADAAVKAGGSCTKAGATSTAGGMKYTCVKSGKKLVWNKGVKVASNVAKPSPSPSATILPIADPLERCKLPVADGRGDVSIGGWPRIAERSKVLGEVVATVILVDFPDAPATMTPVDAFAKISPASETFKEVSYGKINYAMKPQLKWYRMSKNSSDYVAGGWTFEKHRNYILEAAQLADSDVDFSKTDSLIILANPDAKGMGYSGPAFSAIRKSGITLDGRYISNGATSAYDLNSWKSIWLNHEISHSMGLVDLYAATRDDATNPYDGFRYTGEFSYMGLSSLDSNSPGLLAFERWNLGWIADDQVVCMDGPTITQSLTAVEEIGGMKAVVIPISTTKAVVVESRRAIGLDKAMKKSGALVYVVDSSIQSGMGPVKVYPSDLKNDPRYLNAPRALGESVAIEGVTIKVVKSDASGDTVEINK